MERFLRKKLKGGIFENVEKTRSRTMGAIKGRNNKSTDARLRMGLVRRGIKGWVLQPKELAGKPDIYFKRKRLAVFVDGCFWHGCPRCGHIPKTRRAFWDAKIQRNKERDKRSNALLAEKRIRAIRIWEHELSTPQSRDLVVSSMAAYKFT